MDLLCRVGGLKGREIFRFGLQHGECGSKAAKKKGERKQANPPFDGADREGLSTIKI